MHPSHIFLSFTFYSFLNNSKSISPIATVFHLFVLTLKIPFPFLLTNSSVNRKFQFYKFPCKQPFFIVCIRINQRVHPHATITFCCNWNLTKLYVLMIQRSAGTRNLIYTIFAIFACTVLQILPCKNYVVFWRCRFWNNSKLDLKFPPCKNQPLKPESNALHWETAAC